MAEHFGRAYCVAHGYIVTCNTDFTVPLSSRVLATVGKDDDQTECQEMLHRANTQPDLLAALGIAETTIKGTLDARGYQHGSDVSGWSAEVRAELAALVPIRAAIAEARDRA